MLFSSIPFLYYFLPITLFCYFVVPFRFKNFVLFVFSLFFYSWGEPIYILLMIVSILLGYIEGLIIERYRDCKAIVWILVLACGIHIGFLVYFKYMDFMITNLNVLGLSIPLLKLALPIGISFYTFQILSYLIDVYRKDCVAQRNVILFGTYISMFPQLIAGPIVRYVDIEKQLKHRTHNVSNISLGIRRFIIGLSKKVLLANTLGELCVLFKATTDPSVLYYWLYAISFMFHIYFDFSGYSDMAIGLGKIFGFQFLENFNYPFLSKSISEFWRRWHISLGSWFRDYIYIPMGGNKVSKVRWLFNIIVVWGLTGFWHGASWNFIIWGLLFVPIFVLEKTKFMIAFFSHSILSRIYVWIVLLISFVVFNATDLNEIVTSVKIMFTGASLPLVSPEFWYYVRSYGVVLMVSMIGATPIIKNGVLFIKGKSKGKAMINLLEPIVLVGCLILVTTCFINDSYNPFLYFRF